MNTNRPLDSTSYLLRLSLPAIMTQLSTTSVQIVDTIFIGRVHTSALGAVSLCMTLLWNILILGEGIAVGITATVSRSIGAGEQEESSRFSRTGLLISVLLGCAIAPLAIIFSQSLFTLIRMPTDLYEMSGAYFITFIAFLPVLFGVYALQESFRAGGDTRTPMIIGVIMNITNIVLDWLLIFGKWGLPEMGLKGAALASGISFCLGFALLVGFSRRKIWNPWKKGIRISVSHLQRIIKISLPAAAERSAMSISQLLVMVTSVNPMGTIHLASFQIVMRLASLSFMPGFGFAVAASSVAGRLMGAGEPERAKTAMVKSSVFCAVVMLIIAMSYFLFAIPLTRIFTPDPEVIELTKLPLRIYAISAVFLAPTMVFGGGLRGVGDTKYTMKIMLISRFLVRLPLAWAAGILFGYGLAGVWFAMCFDFFLRGFLLVLRVIKGQWKKSVV